MSKDCPNNTHSSLSIGDLGLRNRAFLAPMSGVSDVPFRQLAWEFGAGMVVSEMVASEALTTGQTEMQLKAEAAGLPVHIVQLAGRQPQWMAEATRLAEQAGASVIDINMGCPAKRVTSGYSGSALMRDIDHAMTLIDAVLEATHLPVTLKMRLGWDENSLNAPELAQRAQRAGVSMVTVHARTRNQFYKGEADWTKVAPVREELSIPLIVNGDIADLTSALAAQQACGADGVMIGRASYGAPWLPGQIGAALAGDEVPATPVADALVELVSRHYEKILSFYGVELGMRNARKHLDWYCGHLAQTTDLAALRRSMLTSRDPKAVLSLIPSVYGRESASKVAA